MNCTSCTTPCQRKGFTKGIQRYYCTTCHRYSQGSYTRARLTSSHKHQIILLNNEGMSISSIGRILHISKSSVVRKIREIARSITVPKINEVDQEYEIDEMQTYVGSNEPGQYRYLIYAINRDTRKITSVYVGRRSKEDIGKVVNVVRSLSPARVYTDGLTTYKGLLSGVTHISRAYKINRIERKNLTLRTHLKRLSRKTICLTYM